jgi:hypothetical protein
MTHPGRTSTFYSDQYSLWMRDFENSDWSDGIHFVSDSPVPNISIPTVIMDATIVSAGAYRFFTSRSQAQKTLDSLRYFINSTDSPFLLFVTDNAYVWARNLRFLAERMQEQGITSETHFLWGNCMKNWEGEFLQGGSGYLLSRVTARRLLGFGRAWVATVWRSEDVAFEKLMNQIGLKASEGTSEFFLGQYLMLNQRKKMDRMNFAALPKCKGQRGEGCRPFLAPFNRVVVLHRLSRLKYTTQPIPSYQFPDNVMWFQFKEFPSFCIQNRTD